MIKRTLQIGTYDTALQGWLLTKLELSAPVQVKNFVQVPGRRRGPLDLSTALTDGDPVYESRTLTATFECSEGTRQKREVLIDTMTNWLDGWTANIVLPDDNRRYLVGRVSVARLYNDPAHASVTVTAICEPWRYNVDETRVVLQGTTSQQTATLYNQGRLSLVPLLEVTEGDVLLSVGAASWSLGPGTYALPDLLLPQGGKEITYSGAGVLTFTYREAIL